MSSSAGQGSVTGRPGVLSLSINSRSALYASYMPFLKKGGLFVATTRSYVLGEEVFVLLNLMHEPMRLPIAGHVVWITPAQAQGNKIQGIGIQFSDDETGNTAKTKIEALLGSHLNSSRPTQTL